MTLPREHKHWLYVWVPLFGAFVWFGTLWALLITWLASGRPKYISQEGSIAYISDVGADFLKPLFIAGCAITGVSFLLSQIIESWLRRSGRLLPQHRRREKVFARLSIVGSFIGACGLILLSVFDTKRHTNLHRVFLLVFIVGVGVSGIFKVVEYTHLSHDYRNIRQLRMAFIVKGVIAAILILLGIIFAVLLFVAYDPGAILEWTIAFGFTFYLLTYVYDLRLAKGAERGMYFGAQPDPYRHSDENSTTPAINPPEMRAVH